MQAGTIRVYLQCVQVGMAYLHALNICHGDLKCENVQLTHELPGISRVSGALHQRPGDSLSGPCSVLLQSRHVRAGPSGSEQDS